MWAIIYQAELCDSDENNIMQGNVYIGQSLPQSRKDEPDEILRRRMLQHLYFSKNTEKEIGFMAILKSNNKDYFKWSILEQKFDSDFIALQDWANERERHYIAINGGVLQNMDKKLKQTFNLTSGGQGNAKCLYEGIVAKSNRQWNKFISHLDDYMEINKHINIPSNYICEDGYPLGQTVVTVRQGNMLRIFPERRTVLDNYDGWIWDSIDMKWNKFYKELSIYNSGFGNCNVPQNYVTEDGYNLGNILNHVRQGQFINNFPYREQMLNNLNIIWNPQEDRRDNVWDSIKFLLETFFDENGHSNVPLRYTVNRINLGHHVGKIRHRKDFLKDHPEREEFLKTIDFSWNTKIDDGEKSWIEFLSHMEMYFIDNNNSNVPATYKCSDGYPLGSRCVSIRRSNQYMNDSEKKLQLEQMNFTWTPLEDKWEEFLRRLTEYKTRYKNCKVPDDYIIDGYRLGQIVATVRRGTYITNYPEERKEILNNLGFIWSVFDKAWDDFLTHVYEFRKLYQHPIPRKYKSPDGYDLGGRIHNIKQRDQFIKNNEDRRKLLISLNII
jgi:hypothetical protein